MNTETIEQQAQAMFENKTVDIRDTVRKITLKALSGESWTRRFCGG